MLFTIVCMGLIVIFSYGVGNVAAANASSVYVNTQGNDTWNGLNSTWVSGTNGPKATIRNATGTVTSGGTVYIASGTYVENDIIINSDMNIVGESQKNTIINGNNNGEAIFVINSGMNVTFNDLTLTNGNSSTDGGAIDADDVNFILSGVLTLNNCTLTNNTAPMGGGGAISNQFGSLIVNNSTFINNSASSGGSIWSYSDISNIMGSNFVNNTVFAGGGAIESYLSNLSIQKCNFVNNTAMGSGDEGGAVCNVGILTINYSTFSGNNATSGGGAICNFDNLTINYNNFSDNSVTTGNGGAILNLGGTVTDTNDTFNYNNASYGGAVYNNGTLTETNSTFYNNTAYVLGGAIYNNGNSVVEFNRIVGDSNSEIYSTNGSVNANLNWWGSNSNPSTYVNINVNITSWLVLTANANPSNIPNNTNSTINIDLLHTNNGTLENRSIPDGVPVTIIGALGSLNTTSATIINGKAQSIFTGNNTGTFNIITTIDNQTIQTTINVIPLTVNSVDPSNYVKINIINKIISINFSLPIQPGIGFNNISITGSSGTLAMIPNINGNILTLTPISNYLDDNYTIDIPVNAITDLIGNNLSTAFSSTFTIDTIPPTVNISYPISSEYVHGNVLINATAADNVGITQVLFTTSSGNSFTDTNGNDSWSYNWYTNNLSDGVYSITAKAYDVANNTQSQTIIVIVDNTAPVITTSLPVGTCNITELSLNAIDNLDNNPLIYYSTDNGSTWKNQTNMITLNLNEGLNNLEFYASDAAGNLSPTYNEIYNVIPSANDNIASGLYNSTQIVTLNMNEPGTIYYTTDGTIPTFNSNRYVSPLSITSNTILKYIAMDLLGTQTSVYTVNYIIDTIPPTASSNPTGGVYSSTQTVNLSMNEPGTIYYTTDGTVPTTSSNEYNLPINITNKTSLEYFAIDLAGNQSPVYAQNYNIVPTVSVSPVGAIYNTTQKVTLNMNDDGTIYYTTDGTTPTTSSNEYTSPITIINKTTLEYFAVDLAGNQSPIQSEIYTIIPTVKASINSGYYNSTKSVSLIISQPGTIYYTEDGSTPTTSSNEYIAPITINTNTTLKYFAVDLAGNQSPVSDNQYTIDTLPPTATNNPIGGLYNTNKIVNLSMSEPGTIYYTTDGTSPITSSSEYTSPITITTNTTLKYFAIDLAGNQSPIYAQTYTIDTIPPTVKANLNGGLFNVNKVVTLTMSEPGTIYYTLNGSTPSTTSAIYKGPITISSTTNLKYLAIDLAGNKSPVYTQTYTIDKIPPKVLSTTPKNLAQGISRTATITLKFSENIKTTTNWSKIYVKDLNTGKIIGITKTITGNTLIIKTGTKSAYHWYQIYIPAAAVKDNAGNNNTITTFKYKTN